MEGSEQQLGYNNGLRNSYEADNKVGYCKMYREKNPCMCTSIKNRNGNEYSVHSECSGLCTKQNINIYIEDYQTRRNSEVKCDSVNVETYPYYNIKPPESKYSAINNVFDAQTAPKDKQLYSSVTWDRNINESKHINSWGTQQNNPNVPYYSYMNNNRQNTGNFAQNRIEDKNSYNHVQVNITPAINNTSFNDINKQYINKEARTDDKIILNTVQGLEHRAASVAPSTTSCNNLYVAPPYFTVDKFMNQGEMSARQQKPQFCSQSNCNNKRVPSSLGCEYNIGSSQLAKSAEIQSFNNNSKDFVGIKVIEGPNRPVMHVETSIEPFGVNIRKQRCALPTIVKDTYNCRKNTNSVTAKREVYQKRASPTTTYICGPNVQQNVYNYKKHSTPTPPADQFNGNHLIKLEKRNPHSHETFSAPFNSVESSPYCNQNYARSSRDTHGIIVQNTPSKIMSPPKKAVQREVKRTNYREINSQAHPTHNPPEHEVNMQIIRTVNYCQRPKDHREQLQYPMQHNFSGLNVPSLTNKKLFTKAYLGNEHNKYLMTTNEGVFRETPPKNSLKPIQQHTDSSCVPMNLVSPLDLSVKTVKTKADSTDSTISNCKVVSTEKGFPPKFNFKPNFAERRKSNPNPNSVDNGTNAPILSTLVSNCNRSDALSNTIETNVSGHRIVDCCNRSNSDFNVKTSTVGCRMGNEFRVQTSIPEIKGNIVCSLQNCISPDIMQTCVSQENEQGTGIKLQVTLKRTIPFTNGDDNELVHKKICIESIYHSDLNTPTFHKYSESENTDSKKPAHSSSEVAPKTTDSFTCSMNDKPMRETLTCSEAPQCSVIIKPDSAINADQLSSDTRVIPPEMKPDVSSIIAARIRTKAELKGFTFQENKEDYHQVSSDKENCHSNFGHANQSSIQMNEEDINAWENACDGFVNQLLSTCKNFSRKTKSPRPKLNEVKASQTPVNNDFDNPTQDTPNNNDPTISSQTEFKSANEEPNKSPADNKDTTIDNTSQISLVEHKENLDLNGNDNNFTQKSDNNLTQTSDNNFTQKPDTNTNKSTFDPLENIKIKSEQPEECPSVNENETSADPIGNKLISDIKDEPKTSLEEHNFKTEKTVEPSTTTESESPEQKPIQSISNTIDLTKISVVRLKRERYTANRTIVCDSDPEKSSPQENNTPNSTTNDKCKPTNSSSPDGQTKEKRSPQHRNSQLDSKEIIKLSSNTTSPVDSGKQKHQPPQKSSSPQLKKEISPNKKTTSSSDSKTFKFPCNSVITRLRHQKLRLQEKAARTDKAKLNKCNKKKKYQKSSHPEVSKDPEKLILEMYRYKRALKIPPNLITIKSLGSQKISTSLPDLDFDLDSDSAQPIDPALQNNDGKECKPETVPKSIIDVLHSRVLKGKCKDVKRPHKPTKIEIPRSCKSSTSQISDLSLNINSLSPIHDPEPSEHEHRNVFETKVFMSRTRREHKLHVNQEVLREIFCGGGERSASAPPEVTNISFEYNKAFDTSFAIDSTDSVPPQPVADLSNQNISQEDQKLSEEQQKDDSKPHQDSSETTVNDKTKCKRKRTGRPYRRKFSSGFDYLRKRKKTNHHSLYSSSRLKPKIEEPKDEDTGQSKSEEDVSKEIQKWVLNKSVGQSTLHKAARCGYVDVIVYCLEKMAFTPDFKDNAGYTPLHDACGNGSLDIAKILLQYGADYSIGAHSGIRPLHEASESGHVEMVRMLLSYGADPLLETYSGQTPLMLALDSEMSDFISMHLVDIQMGDAERKSWRFPGPWKIFDDTVEGYDVFHGAPSLADCPEHKQSSKNQLCLQNKKNNSLTATNENKSPEPQNAPLKSDVCDYEIVVDAAEGEGELFEFEESNMPLPPLYLLKDEGMEKWVLLNDLCSLLKVKSKDTLLHKIFPSISPATVSRAFIRELKMCEFLEKATCLQLLCAGEKINICHSKVVLIQYNESVRKLLGVKTIFMKF